MRGKLISMGCAEEKTRIQRIALDLENYEFKTRFWDKKSAVRLLFVGRFVEKKGLEFALRALARIKKEYPFEFRVIGGGPLEGKMRLLAVDLGIANETCWLGTQSHRRVIEEVQSCHIVLQPSVTASNGDSEGGAPTIILEAQACGVPVVSTTHADIPYITRANESALLSPEGDVDSLANNLRQVLDKPEIWPRMGEAGREHVEKYHDVRNEVTALGDIYEDFLGHKAH
jgi:colanic acid/amylovoran biosynthesis glycosyltransferase